MKSEFKLLVLLSLALMVQWTAGIARGDEPQPGQAAAGGGSGAVGAMTVDAATTTATVTAIDPAKRTVTLRGGDGPEVTVTCGPEVRNFDQIKVGDQVKATVTQSLAVFARKPGEAPPAGERQTIALAPKGAMPGAMVATTHETTAKIAAIDPDSRIVALQDSNGQYHTFHVGPNIDLAAIHTGDDVVFRYTERALIRVERGNESEGAQAAAAKVRGAIIAAAITTDAKVTALDKDQRTITLKRPDGEEQTFKAAKRVDLDKVQVGDEVKAKLVEAIAIGVRKPGGGQAPEAEPAQATISPGGEAEPVMADTKQDTAKIQGIDTEEREVTLETPDGKTHIIHAGPMVDLKGLKAGDEVVVRRTPGVVVGVEKD
ncbi:MAG TPA: hypothetical protein VGI81_12455 [Tepidisphaeraceae bacterium]|jgi:uncharacterized OB-fold protein